MMTGEPIDAIDAARLGLINRAVPPEDLDGVVDEFVQKLASMSPIGLKYCKRALNVAKEIGFDEAEEYMNGLVLSAFVSEDRKEGMSAFLEKRQPVFTGT